MVKQYTPEELTQLHQVLYEILEEIVRICDKHNIPYFVIGGTAIGALYDKAILPWDDDIDIGMKREDYNKFLQIASQELREPYFLSWIHTDPHSPYMTLSKKTIYRLMVIMQSCFNSWKTLYYNNVITTTDHVLETSLNHLQPIKFGPLYLKAPDGLENFLRYNYPTLHRYTEEEQDKINNHYPAVLSFNIPNDHIATS